MLWNDNPDEFVRWFVSDSARDTGELQTALKSVPAGAWWAARSEIVVALDRRRADITPQAYTVASGTSPSVSVPTPGASDVYDLLDQKKRILNDESSERP